MSWYNMVDNIRIFAYNFCHEKFADNILVVNFDIVYRSIAEMENLWNCMR